MIGYNQRVLSVGKTGSGKTYANRALLLPVERLVAIDGKGLLDPVAWRAEIVAPGALDAAMRDGAYRIIVRPNIDLDEISLIGKILSHHDGYIVYIDELYWLYPTQKLLPEWSALWTRGRELGIGVWAGVQRPARIPLFALSEAEHYFVFRLSMPEDRKRIAEVVGLSALPSMPDRYGFLYAHPESEEYHYYSRLNLTKSSKGVKLVETEPEKEGG